MEPESIYLRLEISATGECRDAEGNLLDAEGNPIDEQDTGK